MRRTNGFRSLSLLLLLCGGCASQSRVDTSAVRVLEDVPPAAQCQYLDSFQVSASREPSAAERDAAIRRAAARGANAVVFIDRPGGGNSLGASSLPRTEAKLFRCFDGAARPRP